MNLLFFCLTFALFKSSIQDERALDVLFVTEGYGEDQFIDLRSPEAICEARFPDPPYPSGFDGGHLNRNGEIVLCGVADCRTLEDGKDRWTTATLNQGRSQPTFGKTGSGESIVVGGLVRQEFIKSVEVLIGGEWQTFEKDLPHCVLYTCLVPFDGMTMPLLVGGHCYLETSDVLFFNEETREWETHSTLNTPTTKHTCGLIPTSLGSDLKSVIVAGGVGDAVEILDPGMREWRQGPELPFRRLLDAAMVEDPMGGVIVVGGTPAGGQPLDKLIRLQHAGPGAQWEVMSIQLKKPRSLHVAMVIPNHLVNCTLHG